MYLCLALETALSSIFLSLCSQIWAVGAQRKPLKNVEGLGSHGSLHLGCTIPPVSLKTVATEHSGSIGQTDFVLALSYVSDFKDLILPSLGDFLPVVGFGETLSSTVLQCSHNRSQPERLQPLSSQRWSLPSTFIRILSFLPYVIPQNIPNFYPLSRRMLWVFTFQLLPLLENWVSSLCYPKVPVWVFLPLLVDQTNY